MNYIHYHLDPGSCVGYTVSYELRLTNPVIPGFTFYFGSIYRDDHEAITEEDKIFLSLKGIELRTPIYWVPDPI